MLTINEYSEFLKKYEQQKSKLLEEEFKSFTNWFEKFKHPYDCQKKLDQQANSIFPRNYNLFNILNIQHRELQHSSFLADLLNPSGFHGQGSLFLNSFLESFCENHERNMNPRYWYVKKEKMTPNGRIDILITSYKNRTAIVIENKTNSGGPGNQLERYKTWLDNTKSFYSHREIFYLTIKGENHHNEDVGVKAISYKDNINNLLKSCQREVKSTQIIWILEQYLKVIAEL